MSQQDPTIPELVCDKCERETNYAESTFIDGAGRVCNDCFFAALEDDHED